MTERVSRTLFQELAKTGALNIPPEEGEMLRAGLNEQLEVIRQLESIPLDETLPPVIHGNPYPLEVRCELREDEWKPFAAPAEVIAQVPLSRDGYIVSPDTVSEKLETRDEK